MRTRYPAKTDHRGQSHVIGVAILLSATMLSMGMLTASVGTVLEDTASAVDADRVAADMSDALEPVEATGPDRSRLSFTDGRLRTVTRTVRVLNRSGTVVSRDIDALVFTAGTSRVAFVAGAIVRGTGTGARRYAAPPIVSSDGVLLVGVADLNASGPDTIAGTAPTTVFLRTDVSHRRHRLGHGEYRVAIETETPTAWERHFARANATARGTVTTVRRDFDGDGIPSVIATYHGNRTAYLVVHDLRLVIASA